MPSTLLPKVFWQTSVFQKKYRIFCKLELSSVLHLTQTSFEMISISTDDQYMYDYIVLRHSIILDLHVVDQVVDGNRILDRVINGLASRYDDLKLVLHTTRLTEMEYKEV